MSVRVAFDLIFTLHFGGFFNTSIKRSELKEQPRKREITEDWYDGNSAEICLLL